MPHLFDPPALADESAYAAALDELEDLMLSDPDTPAGRRFDELVELIEDYEARNWPAELPARRVGEAPVRYAVLGALRF